MDGHSLYYTDRKTAFGRVRFFLHRMTLSSIEGHSLYYSEKNTAFVRGLSFAFFSYYTDREHRFEEPQHEKFFQRMTLNSNDTLSSGLKEGVGSDTKNN